MPKSKANKSTNVRSIVAFLAQRVLIRTGFALAPGWAAERAARMFLRPWQKPAPGRSWYVSRETPFAADGADSVVAASSFGRPGDPAVLLVHGWEDDHISWAPLIDVLVARGYRVLTLDLPGHGRSAIGTSGLTSIPILAAAVAAVAREAENIGATPLHAVVAHSMGGTATVLAAAELGLKTQRLALLAPPNHPRLFAATLMKMLKLDRAETEQVFAAIERLVGRSMDSLYLPPKLRTLAMPGLLVHSRDDKVVPLQHGQENAAAWSGAQFRIVDGLGHRRLLTDTGVQGMLLHFIDSKAPADAYGLRVDAAD